MTFTTDLASALLASSIEANGDAAYWAIKHKPPQPKTVHIDFEGAPDALFFTNQEIQVSKTLGIAEATDTSGQVHEFCFLVTRTLQESYL